MSKAILIFILASIFSVTSYARPTILTHDEFVHLSLAQKNEFVIQLMKLVVEYESKYQHEVRTSGFNQERFERYTQFMKTFSSFFINEAAADSTSSWMRHSQNFIKNLAQGNNKCIYAGWPSEVRPTTIGNVTRNICIHPKYLGNNSAARDYQDSKDCQGRDKITCNPAIFGYKSESHQSTFCVRAGLRDSDNSALSCMKEALNASPSIGVDPVEKRLQFLRDSLVQNKEIFDGVHKFVYKTCICEVNSSSIDSDYQSYMRPHRTCYGLMKMVGDTIMCKPGSDLGFDTSIFTQLVEYTTSNPPANATSGYDDLYRNFLGKVNTTSEYKSTCGDNGQGGNSKGSPETPTEEASDEIVVTGTPYECKKATCKSSDGETPQASEGATAAFTCEYEIIEKKSGNKTDATVTGAPQSKEDTSIEVSAIIAEKTHELSCPVELAEEDSGDAPKIKITLGLKSAATQKVRSEITGEKNGYKIVWYRKNFPKGDKAQEEKSKDVRPKEDKAPIAGMPEEDKPAPDKDTKPALPEGTSSIPGSEDKADLEEPLKSESYETCADLVKGNKTIKGNCVTIPKYTAPVINPGMNNGQGMGMPRPSSSTSAQGIR